jgi:glutaredoxin-like YruB-family protein
MEKVISHSDFLQKTEKSDKTFLLLFKTGSEQSECAIQNMEKAMEGQKDTPVFVADVTSAKDIHTTYGITSVPSFLMFENNNLTNVVKGCQESSYYKALIKTAIFYAKAKAEGKVIKRVTVYSTPTCSWCNTLKEWLRKNTIPFTDVDVSRDQHAAEELVRRTGQQGVPQTEINGQIVIGFNQQRLKELLEIQ